MDFYLRDDELYSLIYYFNTGRSSEIFFQHQVLYASKKYRTSDLFLYDRYVEIPVFNKNRRRGLALVLVLFLFSKKEEDPKSSLEIS